MTDKTSIHGPAPDLVIQPTKGWGSLGLDELWHYRDLLWFHVWRNIKGKYRQMALGPLWIILQPVIQMIVFSFIFGRVAKLSSEGVPYILMVYVAMVPWTFFSNACQQSVTSLVGQMGVISKVYFPRMIVPLSATLSGLVDFTMSFIVYMLIMLASGYFPGWPALFMPFFLLLAMCSALGVAFWTASLTVRFRDLALVVKYGMELALFLTPVAYSANVIAERIPQWMWLYKLNPMYWVIEGFRWSLLGIGNPPEMYMLIPVGLVILLLISGAFVFRRTERTIVDLL